MIYLIIAFCIVYALFCIALFLGWKSRPHDWVLKKFEPQTRISVVIAFRNEAQNLKQLIKNISAQNYPAHLFNVILVDDHSQDQGIEILEEELNDRITVLKLETQEQGKKKALQKGIQHSEAELIVTTDADCRFTESWLRSIVYKYETDNAKLIAGPVVFSRKTNVFQFFQTLDFIGLQVITGASFALGKPVMCNGANLAFERAAYLKYSLPKQKNEMASGDDVFTLFTLQDKFPDHVFFLKNPFAIVTTNAPSDYMGFWHQRLRWASKSAQFGKWWITAVLTFIYLFNLLLIVLLLWGIFDFYILKLFILGFAVKFLSDALLLNAGVSFFQRKELIRFSPLFQLPHMLYIIVVGLFSQFGKYQWKGRKY